MMRKSYEPAKSSKTGPILELHTATVATPSLFVATTTLAEQEAFSSLLMIITGSYR